MTKEETLRVLAILKAAYPSSYNGMTKREAEGTVAVWYMQFIDIPVDIVLMAVQKAISTNKFPPAISEIKEKISKIHSEASDMLYAYGTDGLSEEQIKKYEWIYKQTKDFKFAKMAEPTIYKMMESGQMLRLGDGGES